MRITPDVAQPASRCQALPTGHQPNAVRLARRWRPLALTLLLSAMGATALAQDRAIVIGQTLTLTGPTAGLAADLQRGRQACADLINAEGGIHGRPLRLLTRDDQGDPANAVKLAQALAERDGAVALFGAMGPAVNAAQFDWAKAAGMVVIGPHGGDVETRNRSHGAVYFLGANQSAEAERLASHIASLGMNRVVIVHGADQTGKAALNALEEGLAVATTAPAATISIKPDGSDAEAVARSVRQIGPQAVLLATSGHATSAMLSALGTTSGDAPLLQVYGLSTAASQAELRAMGTRARGFSMSQVMPFPRDTRFAVVARFQKAMRSLPGDRTYAELEGCMASLLLAEALRAKAAEPSRAGIAKAMEAAGRVNLGGFEIDLADHKRPGSRFTDIVYVGVEGRVAR